jgi:hypothetical protein
MIKDKYAKDAINEFIQYSCAFVIPGEEDTLAKGVGSGTILHTPKDRIAILTAKHIAKNTISENYRLGYYKCETLINDFVAGVLLHPEDVDVALLLVKDVFSQILKKYSVTVNSVPHENFELTENSVLLLCGYPSGIVQTNLKEGIQGFISMTYWCDMPLKESDKKERIRLEWGDARTWGSNESIDLPSPEGISGGPLWCFQRPDVNAIWDPGSIGKIIGIQSAWDRKDIVILEPIKKWVDWFNKSVDQIERSENW